MVTELDKRIYRTYAPRLDSYMENKQLTSNTIDVARGISSEDNFSSGKVAEFGDLSSQSDDYSDLQNIPLPDEQTQVDVLDTQFEDEDNKYDHHLRLSVTGRKHDPNWYLGQIHRFCLAGKTELALQVFFNQMLTTDRVMPDRNLIHVLLSGLANVGDSESAFKVYRKMTELGIPATFATYSRLFKACAEDIATWHRKNRYAFEAPRFASSSHMSPNLLSFAGPGLDRAKRLWIRLHDRGVRLNKVVYNTLLLALARGGDLNSCFQALDEMLGLGGLPAPLVPPTVPNGGASLPPFRPDEYTLTAVLTAVQMAFKVGILTDSMEAMKLGLQLWHTILPRLRFRPCEHHFTLLAGILGLGDQKVKKFMLPSALPPVNQSHAPPCKALELVPDRLPKIIFNANESPSISATNNRLITSEKAVGEILNNLSINSYPLPRERRSSLQSQFTKAEISTNLKPFSVAIDNESNKLCTADQAPVNPVSDLCLADERFALRSPINLLLPLPKNGFSIPLPLTTSLQGAKNSNWQKFALLGGLYGFLDSMKSQFNVNPSAPQLFTKLVNLLPPPPSTLEQFSARGGSTAPRSAELDSSELAVLDRLKFYGIPLDLPLLNALILRRTKATQGIRGLIAVANRHGLTPDEYTWNCFAMACRNAESVKNFLRDYSKTAAAAAPSSPDSARPAYVSETAVRPSLHIYATLLAVTEFNWDAKCVIFRSMLGRPVTRAKSTPRRKENPVDQLKGSNSSSSDQSDTVYTDSIAPNRRMIANLELEIARFRDLVARDVVPADDSSVPACDATGGVIIPPFSKKAFKRFLTIYKAWCNQSLAQY